MKTIELLFIIILIYFIITTNNVIGKKNKKKSTTSKPRSFSMNKTIEYFINENLPIKLIEGKIIDTGYGTCMKFIKTTNSSSINAIIVKEGRECNATAEIIDGAVRYFIFVNDYCLNYYFIKKLVNLNIFMRYQISKCLTRKSNNIQRLKKEKNFLKLFKKNKCKMIPLNEAFAKTYKNKIVFSPINIPKKHNIKPKNLQQINYNNLYSFSDAKKINEIMCGNECNKEDRIKCKNGGYLLSKFCYECICPHYYFGHVCETYKTSFAESSCGKVMIKPKKNKKTIQLNLYRQCYYYIKPSSKSRKIKVTFKAKKPIPWKCYLPQLIEVKYHYDKTKTGVIPCGNIKQFSVISSKGTTVMIEQNHIDLEGYNMTMEYKEF